MATHDPIRVLIVDDSVLYRKIVRDVLGTIPGVDVLGMASNGKIALKKVQDVRPDLLILDIEMPEMNGLECLAELQRLGCDARAIVLSGASDNAAATTVTALNLGAFDFVVKPSGGDPESNAAQLRETLTRQIEAFAASRSSGSGHPVCDAALGAPKAAAPKSRAPEPTPQPVVTGYSGPSVLAIGVSTGGPKALATMLPGIGAGFNAAVLIVQHMPPVFTKSLADDLNKRCALTVSEAVDGDVIEPGSILIAPGGRQMRAVWQAPRLRVRLTDDPAENSCKPSVDYLFRSLAGICGHTTTAVIMTGMGNDGFRGCCALKERGATIVAQDEASCVVYGMPRAVVDAGIADHVAPLGLLAERITSLTPVGMLR